MICTQARQAGESVSIWMRSKFVQFHKQYNVSDSSRRAWRSVEFYLQYVCYITQGTLKRPLQAQLPSMQIYIKEMSVTQELDAAGTCYNNTEFLQGKSQQVLFISLMLFIQLRLAPFWTSWHTYELHGCFSFICTFKTMYRSKNTNFPMAWGVKFS